MYHTTRRTQRLEQITFHASRVTHYASLINLDAAIGFLIFLGALFGYTVTLGPTVLDGDAALFQYTPYVLGVTYPTGFPLYILLGKLWLTIFPFGEIAWRMNFFSALCAAASLPLLYGALRRLLSPAFASDPAETTGGEGDIYPTRWAALAAVLIFATLPTFWRWSTEAKTYALTILLFSLLLYLLARAGVRGQISPPGPSQGGALHKIPPPGGVGGLSVAPHPKKLSYLKDISSKAPLALPAFLLGLQISVHNTAVLLAPGLFLITWLNFRQYLDTKKSWLVHLLLVALPGLFYLYIPLRAEWLIARYGRAEAIERGLLADFYQPGLAGLVRYFSATDFTGGVATNWGLVPQQFFTVYVPLLADEFTYLGIGLGLIGGVALALLRPRLFWPLFLIYLVPIPFVLTYGQGEQSAFLLPSFLIVSIFCGASLVLVERLLRRSKAPALVSALLLIGLIPTLILPQVRYNLNWLEAKWSRATYEEWADALDHPLEPGAAVLAHWGDLTSFWYMQYAEHRRPDLLGLYPPTEAIVSSYLNGGGDLYIAGPLQGWAGGIQDRFRLIPWGRLVRIAPHQADPSSLLPPLTQPVEAVFDNRLRLIAVDYPAQAETGTDYQTTLTWQTLAALPPETTISVRLSQGDTIVAQRDNRLLSGWFPSQTLPPEQHVLSYVPFHIPVGALPGKYRLQLTAYTSYKQPWPLVDGATLLDLGEVELALPATDGAEFTPVDLFSRYDFNGEIELAEYEYTVSRVGQGKGFGVKLLWRAINRPVDNYVLRVEAVDAEGNVLRGVEHQPAGGRAPTASWQAGQLVQDQVDLVLPASAPPGSKGVRVRLTWLRPDGSTLPARRWPGLMRDSLYLDWLDVVEKEGRVFEAPEVQVPADVNLENKARFIGYDSSHVDQSGAVSTLDLKRSDCQAGACRMHFDFYWQGLAEMDQLYFVFIHVVDAEGRIVAQHDQSPGIRGKQPTTSWLPGEVVTDPVDLILPASITAGDYTLRLGMYLPPAGPRLLVLNNEGQPLSDSVDVGIIRITP
jgi:hypothetical protein